MDIQTIATRTGLSNRRIRYVLDHRLLPGMRVKTDEARHGHPRSFSDLEGFGIACAATLLEGGVKREAVVSFVDSLCNFVWTDIPGRSHKKWHMLPFLELVFDATTNVPASALLGDGLNVRFRLGNRDTNWLQPQTFAELKNFRPRVTVSLDLGDLRTAIRGY